MTILPDFKEIKKSCVIKLDNFMYFYNNTPISKLEMSGSWYNLFLIKIVYT